MQGGAQDPTPQASFMNALAYAASSTASAETTAPVRGATTCSHPEVHVYECTVSGIQTAVIKSQLSTCGPLTEAEKMAKVHEDARKEAGVAAGDAECTCAYIKTIEEKKEDLGWIKRRMASSCGPHYHPEDVVAWNEYSCSYEGEGLVGGKRVRNPHRRWTGMLPDCDAHTFGMSDEVMRDVKLMAYHRAGGPDELLDGPESMHCNVLALPIQ